MFGVMKMWPATSLLHKRNFASSTGAGALKPHSGLQKQVISLYRKLLRTAGRKDGGNFVTSLLDSKSATYSVKDKFRRKAMNLNKRDVDRIEYNIRQGEKYVKILQMQGVKTLRSS